MILTHIEQIQARIAPIRRSLLDHSIFERIDNLQAIRLFMESHVFAVWDFMSLLKALQERLCCVGVPWTPPENPWASRFVNEIVLDEESDWDERGNPSSHFELYHRAMERCGAETRLIDGLLREIRSGRDVLSPLALAPLPAEVRRFLGHTFGVIEGGDIRAIASAFTFGREALLPDIFRRIVRELETSVDEDLEPLRYYLDRHISVDGDSHGPKAERLVEELCGDDPGHWQVAETAAVESLEARLSLWDGIAARLDALEASNAKS